MVKQRSLATAGELTDALKLTDEIEIHPGEFKPLGDCTGPDLESAAALLEKKAAVDRREAAQLTAEALRRN